MNKKNKKKAKLFGKHSSKYEKYAKEAEEYAKKVEKQAKEAEEYAREVAEYDMINQSLQKFIVGNKGKDLQVILSEFMEEHSGSHVINKWAEYTFGDLDKVKGDFIEDQITNYISDKGYTAEEFVFHLKLNSLIDHQTNEIREGKEKELQKLIDDNPEIVGDGAKINVLNNQLKNNKITKLINSPFKDFGAKIGKKEGGIHKSDPLGGRYKKDDKTYLLKRDIKKPQHDIAEFLAAKIMNHAAPGSCCEIELVKPKENFAERTFLQGNKEVEKVFLSSKFVDNFQDFHKVMGSKKRHANLEAIKAATNVGSSTYNTKHHLKKEDYKGYEQAFVSRLWVGDFSVHSGNFGVRKMQQDDLSYKKGDLVITNIDPGAAFRKANFTSKINPFQSIKNRVGLGKNYFRRDHPREKIFSQEFSDELKKVAKENIKEVVEKAWQEVCDNFDDITIKDFGKQIGLSDEELEKDDFKEVIKNHFVDTMTERQKSLRDMAFEIDVNLALSQKTPQQQEEALKEVLKDQEYENDEYYKNYLLDMMNNPKENSQMQEKYNDKQKILALKVLEDNEREIGNLSYSISNDEDIDLDEDEIDLSLTAPDPNNDNVDLDEDKLYSELESAISEYLERATENDSRLELNIENAIRQYGDTEEGLYIAKEILEKMQEDGENINDNKNIKKLEEILEDFNENNELYGKSSKKNNDVKKQKFPEEEIVISQRLKEDSDNKAYRIIHKLNEKTKDDPQDKLLLAYKSAIMQDEELKTLLADDAVRSSVKRILNEQIDAVSKYENEQIYKDGAKKLQILHDAIDSTGVVLKVQSHVTSQNLHRKNNAPPISSMKMDNKKEDKNRKL